MRYFNYLSPEEMETVFFRPPQFFDKESPPDILAYALGATLYMPATRENFADEIARRKNRGLVSLILCLEDAVPDHRLQWAEEHLVAQMKRLQRLVADGVIARAELPLIFVRMRNAMQMAGILDRLEEDVVLLAGIVFPKFTYESGRPFLERLAAYNRTAAVMLKAMPILESGEIIYKESRIPALMAVKEILDRHRDMILNIRIGATDFSGIYGIRRSSRVSIYDIGVIRDCIADIVNVFGRAASTYVVSGPVWEYFDQIEELIREVRLDKENGLTGKSVVHPSQLAPVQSLHVVTHEEYLDAQTILDHAGQAGVVRSHYTNKMNEMKPHLTWARRIMIKAEIYGVLHEHQTFRSLLI